MINKFIPQIIMMTCN